MDNPDKVSDYWMSENLKTIFLWITFAVVCQVIDVFGIVANIINIICFVKQGFRDSVNISLLGLAVSDVGCLTTLVWTNICYTPAFSELDLPFDTEEFQYLTSAMTHATFVRVTAWITAIITLERCLCITAPLKVKNIITPRRISCLIIGIYIILLSSVAPLYFVNKLSWKFYPNRNKTLLGIVYTSDREEVETISFTINNVIVTFGAFSVITICTIILVTKLRKISSWRRDMTTHEQAEVVSKKNQKVAKMVVMISSLFIACFIPLSVIFIALILEPEFSMHGKFKNLLIVICSFGLALESINSSVNIFIYYHMSSKYREIIHDLFRLRQNLI